MPDVDSSPIYYGWKIVAAILVLLTFSSGLSFYNHAIYLNVLAARPVFTVQSVSVAVSIFFFSGGISGLGVARWVQDFDPRWCICTGAILSFIALTVLAYVNSVWQLYLVYAVFGMGFSASSLIPATTLVTRWFRKRRAMALSIASTGLSLGGVILTPLSVLMVESLTFETAAPLMGVLYLIGVIPVALIWLRPDPTAMGLSIDGERVGPIIQISGAAENLGSSVDKKVDVSLDGLTFKQARSGRFFWGVASGYIFLMMAQVGGIAHQFGLAREQLTESQAAIAIAILPVASIVGRLIGGWIVDQMSIRAFAIFMMVLQGLSLSLLATGVNAVTLCLGLGLFGVTVGNLLMLQPLLIAEAFGVRDYARIFSVANLLSSWGTAAGPAVLGFVYAMNQNLYGLPYTVAAMAAALGLLLFLAGGKLHG
ncbi:MAG TPA: MFS transporter [Gammaproteobacteria bacterium]|nr:MFS transporter [Gammaproteobacteria bacterium]HAT25383.1 MFS transporter [Gammaproteobacteria bacterium]